MIHFIKNVKNFGLNKSYLYSSLLFMLFSTATMCDLYAVDKVSTTNWGDWNSPSSWSPAGVPVSGDNVIIQHNITAGSGLTFNSGTIIIKTGNTFKVESGSGLNISGTAYITIEQGATLYPNSPGLIIDGGATIDIYGAMTPVNSTFNISDNGKLIVRETGTIHSNSNLNLSGNANIQLDGFLTMSGSITGTSNTVISGTGDLTTCCAINSDGTIFGMKPYSCGYNCSNPNTNCTGNGGSIASGNINACLGSSVTIASTANPTMPGTLTYQWQSNVNNWDANSWVNIPNSNTASLTITPSSSLYYRRRVKSNTCTAYKTASNIAQVTILPAINPGAIAGAGTICSGSSQDLTNSTPATGSGTLTYQWQSSDDDTNWTNISGATSSTYTASPTATTYYRRGATSTTCSASYAYTSSVLVVFNNTANTWSGSISNVWNNASNWSCGVVPTSSSDAIIADVANDPVIPTTANVKSLTIEAGAILDISGSNTLNIYGDLTNKGASIVPNLSTIAFKGSSAQLITGNNTFKNLTIDNSQGIELVSGTQTVNGKITLTNGSILSNGNLVLDLTNDGMIEGPTTTSGSEGITGNITVKRSISSIAQNTFHYISTPLGSGTIADFNDDQNYISSGYASYYYYDETVRNADKDVGFNPFRNTNGAIGGSSLKGFALYQKNTSTEFDITGAYNHYAAYENVPLSFTPYTTGTVDPVISNEADGWHLIGNPYPGPLDWDAIYSNSTNIAGAFYVYENATGTIGVYGGGGAYVNVTSKFIPAMQSFFVRATTTGATISINHTARVTTNPTTPSFYRLAQPELLKLTVSDGNQRDESVIRFVENTSSVYDPEYDAIKFYNDAEVVSLYTKLNGLTYAINTFSPLENDEEEVLIGLKNGKTGSYTLDISGVESIDPELGIHLLDQMTNEMYDIRSINSITFENSNSYSGERFKLIITQPTITNNNKSLANDVKIFATNNYIVAESINHSANLQKVFVYDILGNEIGSMSEINTSSAKIPVSKEGAYIVKVSIGNEVITQKIFKQ